MCKILNREYKYFYPCYVNVSEVTFTIMKTYCKNPIIDSFTAKLKKTQ
jgi:hypothetical protein